VPQHEPQRAGVAGAHAAQAPNDRGCPARASVLHGQDRVPFDDDPATIAGIMDGAIYGTVVQQPYEFGYKSVQLMSKILAGDKSGIPPGKQIFIPTLAITGKNVNDYSDRNSQVHSGK